MNKGEIRAHFKALLNRSDITDALADTFIDQGITRIQRSLRVPSMEKKHTYTFTSSASQVNLPADFLEAIDVYFADQALSRIPMREMSALKAGNEVGTPRHFAREQGVLLLYPYPSSGSLSLNYYASFTEMTSDSDENVLAAIAADLITYGALTYASDYYLDERAPIFAQKYQEFMTELQEQANDAETSGTLQSIRPTYSL
jgi:hypothetical protein